MFSKNLKLNENVNGSPQSSVTTGASITINECFAKVSCEKKNFKDFFFIYSYTIIFWKLTFFYYLINLRLCIVSHFLCCIPCTFIWKTSIQHFQYTLSSTTKFIIKQKKLVLWRKPSKVPTYHKTYIELACPLTSSNSRRICALLITSAVNGTRQMINARTTKARTRATWPLYFTTIGCLLFSACVSYRSS